MKTTDLAESNNILLPNGTIIVEIIIFAIVLFVIWRFVYPPVRDALQKREDMIRRTAEESQQATEKLRGAEQLYQDELAKARTESSSIRDTARAEGQRNLAQLRDQAREEASRVQQRGAEELTAQRSQAVRELRVHVGEFATALAGRVVGAELADNKRFATTAARFFDELDAEGDR
jgi:F-type H+-transporting ATPase subunit b